MKLNKFEIAGYIILGILAVFIFFIGLATILNWNKIVGAILIFTLSILHLACYEEVQKYRYVKRDEYNELNSHFTDLIIKYNKEKRQ